MFRLEGIDHVGLAVADPDKSGEWYQRVLGFERRFEEAWGDRPVVVGAGSSSLALFEREPADDGATPGGVTPTSGHIAFRTDGDNFSRARAYLEERGIPIRTADYGISRSLHIHDPDGYHLEITTYDLEGSQGRTRQGSLARRS